MSSSENRILRLGTRRSLLALTQSQWVADQIPGKVELVPIETQGDRITDIPLSKIEGRDFFSAELDQALIAGRVDLTVHSMKDLSLDRPAPIRLAAISRREDPRDVILFHPRVTEKLKAGQAIRVGTSSPRRLENLPSFLKQALPRFGTQALTLQFIEIRGNVNTRVQKLYSDSAEPLDGVVLAMAGLSRLWGTQNSREQIEKSLSGLKWFVLPLDLCPTAPGQGALAVECRADDDFTFKALQGLHHAATAALVEREREVLRAWGGGCHQRFGATCTPHPELGSLLMIRGKKQNGTFVEEMKWSAPAPLPSARPWDGSVHRNDVFQTIPHSLNGRNLPNALFVAHSRAVNDSVLENPALKQARIWTSGTQSWFQLAAKGLWVEGCAEGLGFDYLVPTLSLPLLKLPALPAWGILTHSDAVSDWKTGTVFATYSLEKTPGILDNQGLIQSIREATHLYWSSGSQFEAFGQWSAPDAHHSCGPGKTAALLKGRVKKLTAFPSPTEWRKWVGVSSSEAK